MHAPSAIGFMRPYAPVLPVPYTPQQTELQQIAYSYAGFEVGVAVTGRISRVLTLFGSPATLHLFPSPSVLTAGPE